MEMQATAQVTAQPRRQRILWVGIALLQILLMGSAFVGGRMLATQNQRNARSQSAGQLPSQLPKEPMAGSGTVQTIQGTVITLARGRGGAPGGGGQGASGAGNQTDVSVTPETKYYKNTSSGTQGNPGGGAVQLQVEQGSLTDVKVGSNIMVWGPKNGERITAEVIYIQSLGR